MDNIFTYDQNKAYIINWSAARHADLPEIKLKEFCRKL